MRVLILLLGLVLTASPSLACSPVEGYKVPTNFELVQKANVIVLARVIHVPNMPENPLAHGEDQWVTLAPIRFLKGEAPTEQLKLLGWRAPENWSGIPTPTTLWQSHFSAGLGACVRQFYQPGELVVAMFDVDPRREEITGSEFGQIFDAFARIVETVESENDVWVKAVERYVALLGGPSEELDARLEAAKAELSAEHTPAAQAIAADLEYQLSRDDRANTWGSFASPKTVTAAVDGQKGAALYCIAGTSPGIMLEDGSATQVELLVDGTSHAALPAPSNSIERSIFKPRGLKSDAEQKPASLFRFVNSEKLFADLRGAWDKVGVRSDGETVIGGSPLDALVRWASQCERLQAVPAPSQAELK